MPFAIIQSNIRSHTPMLLTSDYPFGKAWLGFYENRLYDIFIGPVGQEEQRMWIAADP